LNYFIRSLKRNHYRAWLLTILLLIIPLGSYSYVTNAHADNSSQSPTELEAFRWLTGTWVGQDNPDLYEVWTDPIGDAMIGLFRWTKKNKVWMTEHMSITMDDDKPVFRLRHFSRDMVPWEDKDGALTYPLISSTNDKFVFENPTRDHPRRFIFRRVSHDSYSVTLEGADDSKKKSNVFTYRRVK